MQILVNKNLERALSAVKKEQKNKKIRQEIVIDRGTCTVKSWLDKNYKAEISFILPGEEAVKVLPSEFTVREGMKIEFYPSQLELGSIENWSLTHGWFTADSLKGVLKRIKANYLDKDEKRNYCCNVLLEKSGERHLTFWSTNGRSLCGEEIEVHTPFTLPIEWNCVNRAGLMQLAKILDSFKVRNDVEISWKNDKVHLVGTFDQGWFKVEMETDTSLVELSTYKRIAGKNMDCKKQVSFNRKELIEALKGSEHFRLQSDENGSTIKALKKDRSAMVAVWCKDIACITETHLFASVSFVGRTKRMVELLRSLKDERITLSIFEETEPMIITTQSLCGALVLIGYN